MTDSVVFTIKKANSLAAGRTGGAPGKASQHVEGKVVTVFAAESDLEVAEVVSNTFEVEWPPRSGKLASFPEVDEARWVPLADARVKLVAGQLPALDALERLTAS